jgi:uncharacterized membrane protein YraQ (UPF0718 family)
LCKAKNYLEVWKMSEQQEQTFFGNRDHNHDGHGYDHDHTRVGADVGTESLRGRKWARRWRPLAFLITLLVVAFFAAVRIITGRVTVDLAGTFQDALTLSISVFLESLPFVFLGIFISVIVQVWVPDRIFYRILPREGWLRRGALSLFGVLLPVCECGNVPLARGLMQRGISPASAMTFVLAAPILNPITILTTYQVFGWENGILVARILGGFVIANLMGWVFSLHPHQDQLLTKRFAASCKVTDHGSNETGLRQSFTAFRAEMGTMLPALIIGSALAGLIQVAVARDTLISVGTDPVFSVLALMVLAFVISMCSNVDAFFMLGLGPIFLPGATVAFLVFGPMIDIKMLALLRTTYTGKTLAILTASVALAVIVLGLGMNIAA